MKTKTVKGIVESVNDKGIKIGNNWFNFSHYDPVDNPQEGDAVEIRVDGKNKKWIKELKFINAEEAMKASITAKDVRITRLSLIRSAVEMLKTNGNSVTTEEVESAARQLEEYVYEPIKKDDEVHDDQQDIPF
ncbi:MAG: hypothetical protein RIG61_00995 [Deltaproteobacteria bacterium]